MLSNLEFPQSSFWQGQTPIGLQFSHLPGVGEQLQQQTIYPPGVSYPSPNLSSSSLVDIVDSIDTSDLSDFSSWLDEYQLNNILPSEQVRWRGVVTSDTGKLLTLDSDGVISSKSQVSFDSEPDQNYIFNTLDYLFNTTNENFNSSYKLITNTEASIESIPVNLNRDNFTEITGSLVNSDPINPLLLGSFYDDYDLNNLAAGDLVEVNLKSSTFDTYLQLLNADTGELINFDDDGGRILNSRLTFRVQAGTNYTLRATSFEPNATGAYSLTTELLTPNPAFSHIYGYGLVNGAAAVAQTLGKPTFADVPDLGGNTWFNNLLNAPEVWAQGYTGEGVIVAVIDAGMDITHPDLVDNIWVNTDEIPNNGIDDDLNGYIDDINGINLGIGENNNNVMPGNGSLEQAHGTHVAGIIASVAPDVQIMSVRMGTVDEGSVFNNSGSLAEGIRYAVDNGAKVINMSLGWSDSVELGEALAYAAANNVITISAAGNGGGFELENPASYADDYGISVGAVDRNKNIAFFSNLAGFNSNNYQVVAPGIGIYSTIPGNSYDLRDGTSMATPQVSGVAALMLSANPNLSHNQVRDILINSATRLV
ncbi:MAG: S8 family serine peptidase [Symploca sp. SIO3C6]|nr:S8 family serine peptidase [Symploca sp. SIO3C6]